MNKMKYSIIIPYRDRSEHLKVLLPHLHSIFKEKDYEIIVTEQTDSGKFCKVKILNAAAKVANGDILIINDVDHISISADYFRLERENLNVYYPVNRVIYVDENFKELASEKIPSGYRMHKYGVDNEFFGGCIICKKSVFEQVNGFFPLYIGWSAEDEDFLSRLKNKNFNVVREKINGDFIALPHTNNDPGSQDPDLQRNRILQQGSKLFPEVLYTIGWMDQTHNIEKFNLDEKTTWLKYDNSYPTNGIIPCERVENACKKLGIDINLINKT